MSPFGRDLDDEKVVTKLSFNDMDSVLDTDNNVSSIEAPKTIERLEEISTSRALERRMEQEEEDEIKVGEETEENKDLFMDEKETEDSLQVEEPMEVEIDTTINRIVDDIFNSDMDDIYSNPDFSAAAKNPQAVAVFPIIIL